MLKGHWHHVAILFALVLFTAIMEGIGFSLVVPLLQTMMSSAPEPGAGNIVQRLFAYLTSGIPENWRLTGLLGLLALVFLIKAIGLNSAAAMTRWFIDSLRANWVTKIFLAYTRAPYAQVAVRPHGEIVQNIIGETELAARGVLLLVESGARLIQVVVLVALLLLTNWQTTLFILVIGGLGFALSWGSTRRFALEAGRSRQLIRRQTNDIVSESISGIRTVKLLDIAIVRAKTLRKMLLDYRRVDTKFEVASGLPSNTIDLIAVLAGAGIIFFMSKILGLRVESIVPTMALFGLVFVRLATSAGYLFSKRLQINSSLPPLRAVYEAMVAEPERILGSVAFPGIQGDIVFDRIALQPPGREVIFDGLNMTIPPVGLTAIVGPSGSGKTTLIDFIVRLREPDAGQVLINGRDIREFDVRSLRARVGYLSQEVQLFNGTVQENLRLGRMDATDAELVEATKRVYAHDFITAMPQGFDTPLGRGAVTLSGGQRQRLALARELLRNPELFIFDEPTSALDQEAEGVISELINELSRTHPVIIISHRPDVIHGAKVIYRIEHGKAVPMGLPELAKVAAGSAS